MIKVKKSKNLILISGHAGMADYGKDIVCASVSSIVYTTINAIAKINDRAIEVKDDESMEIKVISNDEITSSLISNMMDLLKDLESDYPKNINVKEC